jgi:hypothetical protein
MPPAENYTPEQFKKAMLPDCEELDALDELIATGEAVFDLINISDLDIQLKNAIYQLEKLFAIYARLAAGAK